MTAWTTKISSQELAAQFLLPNWDKGVHWAPQQWPYAGYIFHQSDLENVAATRTMLAAIYDSYRRANQPPPLLMVTEEGGVVHRFPGIAPPPSALLTSSLGARTAYDVGRRIGQLLAMQGFNWNLAPVMDVYVPGNQVIGSRAFSDEAQQVAMIGKAWIRGHQAAGVPVTVKHFPGHGHALDDSHRGLSQGKIEMVWEHDLLPFHAVLSEAPAVMTAHVQFSEFDQHPATVSIKWITGILRQRLHYKGIVVTDALAMGAIRALYTPEDAAVRALQAGADLIDCGGHADLAASVREAVAWAIDHHILPSHILTTAQRRVRRWRQLIRSPDLWPAVDELPELEKEFRQWVFRGSSVVRGNPRDFSIALPQIWIAAKRPTQIREGRIPHKPVLYQPLNTPKLLETLDQISSHAVIVYTDNLWQSKKTAEIVKRFCQHRKVLHVAVTDPLDAELLPEASATIAVRGNPFYAVDVVRSLLRT
ncbi:Glycosyl hydrolase family 3 N terminal domain-containing protein [Sulfobacillus thermosulfidooxidans DSM 9293]|uniref:beta-N-acetylhexosaminidase n=1 Tax=Sulfobacillus thermosulfidooxidans (strain DSM 9293 / VKM B-1269 / AT-1) TaxID=929705 RepID=A0A1W1WPT6_SULTA|nr:glycoside hydrolase family 3 N-terminal domain-containing protein [Sulfobacillus thermosulfidooxidans]SMC08222.1 Glycosyl hydrolase family 3 N terminal domain-containing protein [Sulfobacillus thermosulfidooxidans DSM 9293]